MAGVGGDLDGGRELSEVEQGNPSLGRIFRKVIQAVNTLATNTASSATGEVKPPKPPDSVTVTVPQPINDPDSSQDGQGGGEHMHISIAHSGMLQRGIQYFSEIDTNPNFSSPMVVHHGASRTSGPIPLPTFTGNPAVSPTNPHVYIPIPHTYYVRSYAQYPSSQPSAPTVAGGASSPTPFSMSGATLMNLAPSSGSGTASNTGQQGGSGLGKVQQRS
jgi:hypothetical protein